MLDRLEAVSRTLCIGLGALLFLQLVNAVWHGDPLRSATIPELPTLPASTATSTNSMGGAELTASQTNRGAASNATISNKTNSAPIARAGETGKTQSAPSTNMVESPKTNSVASANIAALAKTNSSPMAKLQGPHTGMPRFGPGKKVDLPPAVQARVDNIVQSEILGPFVRPMPMALLGIAGEDAFLRAPDGQSGMVKEGAELGTIKLLRIGINRVLVEENGEKKELMLFAGMGGESLLPAETNSAPKTNGPITKKEIH